MPSIGGFSFAKILALAPMAGVSDLPYRQTCQQFGANWTVSEMLSCQTQLYQSRKSQSRLEHSQSPRPVVVQLLGADPKMMAAAAAYHAERGADIIDINMGCPAKKVCKTAAGSALLGDPSLVGKILKEVVGAAQVPVSLKIRTGLDGAHNNSELIGSIAQDCGVALLSVHGRSRAQKFTGAAEYHSVANLVQKLTIPVIANGDIGSGEKARWVLEKTGAAGVMVGRAACGNPWIFAQIHAAIHALPIPPKPSRQAIYCQVMAHLKALYDFYGEQQGVKIARKHLIWYLQQFAEFHQHKAQIFAIKDAWQQLQLIAALAEQ